MMKETFLRVLDDYRDGDIYKVEYFKEEIEVQMSIEDIEVIIDCAIKLMDEVEYLGNNGILSKKIIQDRWNNFADKESESSKMFSNVITGFVKDGIYDRETFYEVAREVGSIVGYQVGSGYWQLVGRTTVLSSLVSVIEGYFINEDLDDVYENCVWMYIKSCLYMKYSNIELQ